MQPNCEPKEASLHPPRRAFPGESHGHGRISTASQPLDDAHPPKFIGTLADQKRRQAPPVNPFGIDGSENLGEPGEHSVPSNWKVGNTLRPSAVWSAKSLLCVTRSSNSVGLTSRMTRI